MSEWTPCDGCPRPLDCPAQRHRALCKRLAADRARWLPVVLSAPPGPRREPALPTVTRMVGSVIRTAAAVVRHAATTGEVTATETEQARRWSLCRECDHYRASDQRCGQLNGCGCYLSSKIPLTAASCPVGRW